MTLSMIGFSVTRYPSSKISTKYDTRHDNITTYFPKRSSKEPPAPVLQSKLPLSMMVYPFVLDSGEHSPTTKKKKEIVCATRCSNDS
jgi:hypothetical protein